jgi:thiol-disulfide isomerase/thioredoxin
MMYKRGLNPVALLVALVLGWSRPTMVMAQEGASQRPSGQFKALEALDADYQKQFHDLECRQLADLAALAEKSSAREADAAFERLFSLAIARKLCPQAQASARHCLNSRTCGRDVVALAAMVQVLARVDKGEHDQAIADIKGLFLNKRGAGVGPRLDTDLALAVGEALLERLIHDGRFDVARKLCDVACEGEGPAIIEDHFENRMARLNLIGKPAPPIAGADVDGKPVSLADFKGKVVLIDFWATWCPPCVASIPTLKALSQKFRGRGFVILGINVDATSEDVKEPDQALHAVRRFLVKQGVDWINVPSGTGPRNSAAAYHVEQIPANFLVGRDGAVVAIDQRALPLERAIEAALGLTTKPETKD